MWRPQRLIAELDGRSVHATNRAFESDRRRDRMLLAEGWRSTRVTWLQIQREGDEVAADLRRLLDGPEAAGSGKRRSQAAPADPDSRATSYP